MSQERSLAQAKREEQLQKIHSIYAPMTEEIELPSGGRFYASGASSVKVKPITAKEEDILSNQRLLRSGKAFDELMKSCVVEWNGIQFNELLVGDKNTILMAIRVISLGEDYDVELTCPHCEKKSPLNISLKEDLSIKRLTQESVAGKNEFQWQSPKGINYTIRLMTHKDQQEIEQETKRKKAMFKANYKESPISDFLVHSIVSIEDIRDKSEILEILANAPSDELRALLVFIKEISPDYNMKYDFECLNCGETTEVAIPMNAGFFWPDRKSTGE